MMTSPSGGARGASRFIAIGCLALSWVSSACDDSTGSRLSDGFGDARLDAAPLVDAAPPVRDAVIITGPPKDAAPPPLDAAPPDAAPDAAAPDAALPGPDAVTPPPVVTSVVTVLGAPETVAGIANRITCEARDADDVALGGVPTEFELRPPEGWRVGETPTEVVGVRAGPYRVTCTANALGLRDSTPERWDVAPGPPARVRASVDRRAITAGETINVTCEATDREGNPVDAATADIVVTPAGAAAAIDGWAVTLTTAGRYRIDCALPGAESEPAPPVDVRPGLPAALAAAVVPERPAYEPGTVVTLVPLVTDAYDNVVDAVDLSWSAAPDLPRFGEGRFRPDAEGRYTLTVRVDGPTHEDRPLSASVEILVDAGGPAIECTRPESGAMVARARLRLEGRVADVAGVRSFTVDGREVALDAEGRFGVDVDPTWGLNVHNLVARDAVDNAASTFCSYFASERYLAEAAPLDDAILLHLTPAAVDDGPPDRPLTSLADLLRAVVNSPGLLSALDTALRAQNPVVPTECRQSVAGFCIFRLGAEYRGMSIRGPNTLSIELVDGGLRVRARLANIAIQVKLRGDLGNDGTLTTSHVTAVLRFDVGLVDGRPDVRVAQVESVEVGTLDSDFQGFLTGALLDLIFGAFERQIRTTLTSALRDYLQRELDALLSDVLAGLDIASLGAGLQVPGLGGSPPIPLALDLAFSTLDANPSRLLMGVSTRVNGPAREGAPSAGVPVPPGPVRIELEPEGTVGGAVSIGLLNQLLHRLWRGGLFQIDAAALLGDLPAGTELEVRVLTPPAVDGMPREGRVRLHLGPAVGELVYPGLFETPLRLRLAATATASVALADGNAIRFGRDADGIRVETLWLTVEDTPLTPETRALLERLFRRLIQSVIDHALNEALPELPIPDFALPASLAEFGIPVGTRIGLRGASLSGTQSHWILDGEFRE